MSLKVIFVNRYFHPDHSATSQLLSDLSFDLVRQGFSVEVVTSRQLYGDSAYVLKSNECINDVTVRRVWTTGFGRQHLAGRAMDYLTFYISAAWCLLRIVRPEDTVVVKTDPPLISVIAALVVRLRGARLINWLQDIFPEVASRLGVRQIMIIERALVMLRNYSLRAAHKNVVLGDRMAGMILHQGILPESVVVIPNWADGERIMPVQLEDNSLRVDWGIQKKFVVGYSGNMGRAHEFETLISAAAVLKSYNDIVFVFIGGGAQRQYIEQRTRDLELTNIRFQQYQPRERLSDSLGAMDIHIISLLPAMEGLIVPSKFYGIAAAGRPTIYIGDCDGEIPGIIKAVDCGVCIEIGDSSGLAEAILDLSSQRERVSLMGRSARKIFEERFSKEKALDAWVKVLS